MNVMKNFNNSKIKSTAKCTARSTAVESAGIPYHMPTSNKTLGQKLKIQERKKDALKKNMLLQHKEAVSSGGQMQNVKIYDCCINLLMEVLML